MSEEKLYVVKNDEGKYWDFSGKVTGFWARSEVEVPATDDKDLASALAMGCGDCVVTFVEEPKKVVLSKEQAEIVEGAHGFYLPARYISINCGEDEELLMNAFVNGYTVEKEKKYLVYKVLGGKQENKQIAQAYRIDVFSNAIMWLVEGRKHIINFPTTRFTESEIEHYGLQGCEKEEVTDDGIR